MTNQAAEQDQFTLTILMQHAGKLLDDRLREGFDRLGLSRSQGRVVHLLERVNGVQQRWLAEMMNVSAPTVSGIVTRMEADGLLERRRDPADERVSLIFLSRKGRAKARAAHEVVEGAEQVLVAGLSRPQLREAHRILRQLRDNLGGCPPGPEPPVDTVVP